MSKYASKVIEQALAWLGYNESDGSHRKIIDVYNSQKKLPRSYPVEYTDDWCATFVSSVAVKLGYTAIMPTECGCEEMIKLYQKIGGWDENDARVPNPGELIFYDWQDNGKGDNRGYTNHVGIVEKVANGKITVIEGNYSNSVKRRTLNVDGLYIRGYAVPKYDKETATEPEQNNCLVIRILKKGDKGEDVRALQILLAGNGCKGDMFEAGYGSFGANTEGAVKLYQRKIGVPQTGVADETVWCGLLGIN
jgi:hypothetical protein